MIDTIPRDVVDGRRGEWMQTSRGGKFFPADPRPEEVYMTDIANGLALDCRYAGQGSVRRFYSVAEHSVWIARAMRNHGANPWGVFAGLLHDGAEAYINDLPRAVKAAMGEGYRVVERAVQAAIWQRYGLAEAAKYYELLIKEMDARIVPLEKAVVMRHPQAWAHDIFEPLENIRVCCFEPLEAKVFFAQEYLSICRDLRIQPEEIEP